MIKVDMAEGSNLGYCIPIGNLNLLVLALRQPSVLGQLSR
jgi:hypothetical protein